MRKLFIAAAAAVALLVNASESKAALQLSWSASTALLGNDATNFGFSVPLTTAGGFTISGSAAGTAQIGSPQNAAMDLSTITVSSSGSGTVTLYLTQNNIASPGGLGNLSGTLTGHFITGGGSFSMLSYGNDTNSLYGNAVGQAGTSPTVSAPNNVVTPTILPGGTQSVVFNAVPSYSMTEILTINFSSPTGGSVSLSSDGSTSFTNPAPAGLVLALTGAPVLGLGALLRRRKVAVAA
jgi:hypothetical protein